MSYVRSVLMRKGFFHTQGTYKPFYLPSLGREGGEDLLHCFIL